MKYLHFFAVDIVLGVIAGGFFAERVLGASLPIAWWFVVPPLSWCVYMLDRLLDARKGRRTQSLRHSAIQQHSRVILPAICVVAVASTTISILFLPFVVLVVGSAIMVMYYLHHVLQKLSHSSIVGVLKDVNVAVCYGATVWSIPLLMPHTEHNVIVILAGIVCHLSLVLGIIATESEADRVQDVSLQLPSIATDLGSRGIRWLMWVLTVVCLTCTVLLASTSILPIAAVWTVALLILPHFFTIRIALPYKRLAAELLLSVPLIIGAYSCSLATFA